jgi:high affinity Mn2+ porin
LDYVKKSDSIVTAMPLLVPACRVHVRGHARLAPLLIWLASAATAGRAEADGTPAVSADTAVHGQMTYTEQESSDFSAPYRGPNSLSPGQGRQTFDATLYLGLRLGTDGELWINPEIDQGYGLDNTLGAAGFPSGEAYKVGRKQPYLRVQRLFVRETVSLGGDIEEVGDSINQLAGHRNSDRVVVTAGKISVGDIFDVNQYAHDPRNDFLNWSVIDSGPFDYAADAWGYTVGLAVEWYRRDWTLRGGLYDLSTVPNSEHLQPGFHQFQWITELERRYVLQDRAGKLALTVYQSHGDMALLKDAVAAGVASGGPIDPAVVRHYRTRTGASLNLEQGLTANLGLFARLGAGSGNVEAYEFTDIDRSALIGLSARGAAWRRATDSAGVAVVHNKISADRERYLAAGGLGILVGDGRLPNAGPEQILEAFYNWGPVSGVNLTLDYQRIAHPAYNRDRGPVSVFAVRAHYQF